MFHERASGVWGCCPFQHASRGAEPVPPRAAGEQRFEGGQVEDAASVGFVERPFELGAVRDLGEVEQGTRDGRRGDAVDDRAVVGVDALDAVHVDAGAAAGAGPRHGDVDRRSGVMPQPVKRGRAAMTERGGGTAREHRGHPMPVRGQQAMANRVDPDVHPVQPARGDAMLDGARIESEGTQLAMGDHAVLPARQLGGRAVRG